MSTVHPEKTTSQRDSYRLPEVIDTGRSMDTTVEWLLIRLREHNRAIADNIPLITATEERYACGYPLPSFQRPNRWDVEKQRAFIESIYLGLPLGTYTVHDMDWKDSNAAPVPFSGWLIDGQQRLTAIEDYINDKFPVFGFLWSELNAREQRRFKQTKFCHNVVRIWDEQKIRDLYNRLAFGGVAHKPDERA